MAGEHGVGLFFNVSGFPIKTIYINTESIQKNDFDEAMKICHTPKKRILAQKKVIKKIIARCIGFVYNWLFLSQKIFLLYITKLIT